MRRELWDQCHETTHTISSYETQVVKKYVWAHSFERHVWNTSCETKVMKRKLKLTSSETEYVKRKLLNDRTRDDNYAANILKLTLQDEGSETKYLISKQTQVQQINRVMLGSMWECANCDCCGPHERKAKFNQTIAILHDRIDALIYIYCHTRRLRDYMSPRVHDSMYHTTPLLHYSLLEATCLIVTAHVVWVADTQCLQGVYKHVVLCMCSLLFQLHDVLGIT